MNYKKYINDIGNRIVCHSFVKFAFIILMLVFSLTSMGQNSLFVSTDRSLYIAGENIKVNIGTVNSFSKDAIYVYCDLIGQDGTHFSGKKLRLTKQRLDFDYHLSSEFVSGFYILRAYTYSLDSMSNKYVYAFLKVVNPQSVEILKPDLKTDNYLTNDSVSEVDKGFTVSLNKKVYRQRDLVEMSLEIDASKINPRTVTVSIVPNNSFVNYKLLGEKGDDKRLNANMIGKSLRLSGFLNSKKSKLPISNQRIYFSVVHSNDVMTALTDSMGRWVLFLPDYYGMHELIISPEDNNDDFNIRIDKEFDMNSQLTLKNDFVLDSNEQILALQLVRNMYVGDAFKKTLSIQKPKILNQKIFYNSPDQIVRIMDYIDMPKLSMYFTELPGAVHLSKQKGKFNIRIVDKNGIQLLQRPLLLVDNVPISDLEFILAMNPKSVNRIEVVNSYYQKGDVSFGGIINFITNELDFGGLSFPESSVSINYQFLEKPHSINQNIKPLGSSPDARNTLAFFTNINQSNILRFYTADDIKEYQIIIQGFDKNGERKSHYSTLKVLAK